jgi:hypothetical protein
MVRISLDDGTAATLLLIRLDVKKYRAALEFAMPWKGAEEVKSVDVLKGYQRFVGFV